MQKRCERKLIDQNMMVNQGDFGNLERNVRRLENFLVVHVDNDKQGVGADKVKTGIPIDEHVLIFRQSCQLFPTNPEVFTHRICDNMQIAEIGRPTFFFRAFCQDAHGESCNADTRTDCIKIGIGMSHHQDVACLTDPLRKQLSCHTGGD